MQGGRGAGFAKREKRYGWFRKYNNFTRHPKWRLVARRTGVPLAHVLAILDDLLCHVSEQRQQGYIGDFKAEECAACIEVPAEDVRNVIGFLELPEVGWIMDDFIVSWFERQPQDEDPTAAERKRRSRARRRQAEAHARGDTGELFASSRVTPSAPALAESEARTWLYGDKRAFGEGALIVARALGTRPLAAQVYIARWCREHGAARPVAAAIRAAQAQGLAGTAFERALAGGSNRLAGGQEEPVLPLPPALQQGGKR